MGPCVDLKFHLCCNKTLQYNPHRITYFWSLPPKCVCSYHILLHILQVSTGQPLYACSIVTWCSANNNSKIINIIFMYVRRMRHWLLLNVGFFKWIIMKWMRLKQTRCRTEVHRGLSWKKLKGSDWLQDLSVNGIVGWHCSGDENPWLLVRTFAISTKNCLKPFGKTIVSSSSTSSSSRNVAAKKWRHLTDVQLSVGAFSVSSPLIYPLPEIFLT
jgi:hypothetical protein